MRFTSPSHRLLCGTAVGLALAASLSAGPAFAADTAATTEAAAAAATPPDERADYGVRVEELTVVGASPAITAAPVKASLQATEPQAIVTREAIDQFVPQTSDYTEIVLLTPSVSGISFNGPGLYEAKTTLRGFKDGEYNVTYDGIPFGDTNNPTHHSTSFFPAATIGAVVVDRGPGQASQLGQANFGGSINLFSPEVAPEFGGSVAATFGSWDTEQLVAKLNTGAIDALHGARALVDVSALHSSGYLQNSGAQGANALVRAVVPIVDSWNLTVFSTYNYTRVYQSDSNGATLAQVQQFGKDFALNNDPSTPFYTGYNTVKKHSSFSYARLTGDVTPKTHVENTAYTYYYSNRTLSPQDVTGTRAPEKTIPAGHIPGYTKLNYYHVYGDILRVTQELPYDVTAKAGIWLETSKTKRSRYDYDLNTLLPDLAEKCPTLQPGVVCNRGAASNVNYVQGSTWDQYQPFLDVEWKPLADLTVTPGIKYVHFKREVNALVNQGSGTQLNTDATWSKTLYFLTANYRVMDNLSAYAQYATGFLVPDLSTLQVQKPNAKDEEPQTSKNYQLGAVYHGGRFTFDGDVYLIKFNNKFQSLTVGAGQPQAGETIFYNLGGATYKGIEAQGTFAVTPEAFLFANGSINSAKTKGGTTTILGTPVTITGGTQIAGAPKWTAVLGAIWKPDGWSISITDKIVGRQWSAEGEPSNLKIDPYHTVDLTVVRNLGRVRIEAAIYNLFDSQKLVQIKQAGKTFNVLSAGDQYYFQPERSVQVSARVSF